MTKPAIDSADSNDNNGPGQISVAEQIHRHLDRLTPTERKPARLLLGNYPVVGLEPLANFAQRADVSHPSILRFIAKLGYSGYAEFQAVLRAELEARLKSPLAKRDVPRGEPTDGSDLLASHADAVCDNIRQSIASLPRTEFDSALGLLGDWRNAVYLLGGRFTDPLANYVYMHLRVLRPRVAHVTGPPVSWSEYLIDMDQRAVLLVFDIRRYQQDVIRFAHEAAERGASIVLVTDNWLSPIAAQAAHVLSARVEVPSSWDSIIALGTLAEALIAGVSEQTWPRLEQRIRELEQLRSQFEDTGAES